MIRLMFRLMDIDVELKMLHFKLSTSIHVNSIVNLY